MMEVLIDQNGIAEGVKKSDSRKMMKVLVNAKNKDQLKTLMQQETVSYTHLTLPTILLV